MSSSYREVEQHSASACDYETTSTYVTKSAEDGSWEESPSPPPDADVAALGVEKCAGTTQPDGRHGITLLEPGHVAALFGDGRDIILCADDAPDIAIFEGAAPLVQSAAYMRLTVGGGAPPALFALGSRFEGTFGANHGAELLSFLARILERCIGTWLNLPGPRAIPLIPR